MEDARLCDAIRARTPECEEAPAGSGGRAAGSAEGSCQRGCRTAVSTAGCACVLRRQTSQRSGSCTVRASLAEGRRLREELITSFAVSPPAIRFPASVMVRLDLTVTLLVAAFATIVLLCIFTNAAGAVMAPKSTSAPHAVATGTKPLKSRTAAPQPVTLQRAASQMSTETLFGDAETPRVLSKSGSDARRTQSFVPSAPRIAAFDFAETGGVLAASPPNKKPQRAHLSRSVSALPL